MAYDQSTKQTTLTYFNQDGATNSNTFDSIFIDELGNAHILGGTRNRATVDGDITIDNDYIGFILEFCLWSGYSIPAEPTGPNCGPGIYVSPVDYCLNNCAEDEFYNEETELCEACREDCEGGCVRAENCDPCIDPECETCISYDVCDSCQENTNNDTADCQCLSNYAYNIETDTCDKCHFSCETCSGAGEFDCLTCAVATESTPAYYHQPGTNYLCLEQCPSGFVRNGRECTGNPGEVICVEFDCKENTYNESVGTDDAGITILGGSTQPIYLRGLYFDGQDFAFVQNLVLHHTFTLEQWVFAMSPNGDFYSMTETTNQELKFAWALTGTNKVQYLRNGDSYDSALAAYELNAWSKVTLTTSWIDKESRFSTYLNGNLVQDQVDIGVIFRDDKDWVHMIGAKQTALGNVSITNFTGYIWSFCVFNLVQVPTTPDQVCTGAVESVQSPDNICLYTCNWNEYVEGEGVDQICTACLDTCTEGCINGVNCNQCIDEECAECVCYEPCETCIDNASKNQDDDCVCNQTLGGDSYFYDAPANECKKCHDNCFACYGESAYECTECDTGSFKQPGFDICLPACPSGFGTDPTSKECTGEPDKLVCFTFDCNQYDYTEGSFSLIAGANASAAPDADGKYTPESDDPYPVYMRGAYFDGTMFFQFGANNLALNHSFTLELWIKRTSTGADNNLFSSNISPATGPGLENFFNYVAYNGDRIRFDAVTANLNLSEEDDAGSYTSNQWSHVAISFSYDNALKKTTYAFYSNGIERKSGEFDEPLLDLLTNTHIVGAELDTISGGSQSRAKFFEGFIWKFCIYQQSKPTFDDINSNGTCGTNRCTNCPVDPDTPTEPLCVIECAEDEYLSDTGSCEICEAECSEGCRNGTNCNKCFDEECKYCSKFDEDHICETCLDETTKINGDCACRPGTSYDSDTHICESACDPCCIECDGTGFWQCDVCADSCFSWGERICRNECPTGFIASTTEPICEPIADFEFCMTFDSQSFDRQWVQAQRNVDVQSGATAGIEQSDDDPVPIYRRGVWFNGAQYFNLTGLILNHTFILKIWTKVYEAGTIYAINRESNTGGNGKDDYFLISANPNGVSFTYNGELKTDTLAEVGSLDLGSNWNHVALCNTYDGTAVVTSISVSINSVPTALVNPDNSEIADLIADSLAFKHHIGVDFHTSQSTNWFTGFIWEICYYERCTDDLMITDFSGDCGANACFNCPEKLTTEDCLVNCDWNQFFEDGTCNNCDPALECPMGCVREDNCNVCFEDGCELCDNWEDCDTCIPNASEDNSGECQCNNGFYYDIDTAECRNCDPACETCFGGDKWECLSCSDSDPGYYLIQGSTICVAECPTGFTAVTQGSRRCEKAQDFEACITFDKDDTTFTLGDITIAAGSVTLPQPSDLPVPAFRRGLWYNGNSFMNITGLVLNHTFTVKTWIRPGVTSGVLLSITKLDYESPGNEDHLVYGLTAGTSTRLRYESKGEVFINVASSGNDLVVEDWYMTSFSMSWSKNADDVDENTAILYHNTAIVGSDTAERPFFDQSTYQHLLAAEINVTDPNSPVHTQFYTGFIYQICYYNFEKDTSTEITQPVCNGDFCINCPTDGTTSTCIIDCAVDEHLSNETSGTCTPCLPECPTCVNGRNCLPCIDNLCDTCLSWEGCDECKEGAGLEDGICECNEFFFENNDKCDPCNSSCSECYGTNSDQCDKCADDYFKQINYDICIDRCPTGQTEDSDLNECTGLTDDALCVGFPNIFTTTWTDPPYNGAEVVALPTDSAEPAYVILDRGLYLDAAVGNYLQINNFMQYMTFTVTAWIRPDTGVNTFTLYSINKLSQLTAGNQEFLTIDISQGSPSLVYRDDVGTTINSTPQAASINPADWNFVAVGARFDYTTEQGSGFYELRVRGPAGDILTTDTYDAKPLLDNSVHEHLIGAKHTDIAGTLGGLYTGLIYEFKILNIAIPDTTGFVTLTAICPGTAYCSANGGECPAFGYCADVGDPKCLIDCEEDEFVDENGECAKCNDACTNGCIRDENCELCADEECKICDGYNEVCTECIENASLNGVNGTDCSCDPGFTYNIVDHVCEASCHESCFTCSDVNRPRNCDICSPGWYAIDGSQICMDVCPTGFVATGDGIDPRCEANTTDGKVFCLELDDVISEDYVDSISGINVVAAGDKPKPAIHRGVYFDGNSWFDLQSFILNHTHTIIAWVKPDVSGDYFFSISRPEFFQEGSDDWMKFSRIGDTLAYQLIEPDFGPAIEVRETHASDLTSWQQWVAAVEFQQVPSDQTVVQLYVNSFALGTGAVKSTTIPLAMVIHEAEYETIVGSEFTSDSGLRGNVSPGFTGFMWSLQIWATRLTDLSFDITDALACDNGCTVCPLGGCSDHTGRCINNCPITDFIDEDNKNACGECAEECTDGCVRPDNCNLCEDEACGVCSGFDEGECITCIDNAIPNEDGDCTCQVPYFYLPEQHECVLCHPNCTECDYIDVHSCDVCSADNFKQPDSRTCLPECPSGFTEGNGECVGDPGKITCLTVNAQQSDWTLDNGIELIGGANLFSVQPEEADPTPIYSRGFWFDGEDYGDLRGLRLHLTFTLKAWLRYTSGRTIFSVSRDVHTAVGSEQWLTWYIATNFVGVSLKTNESDELFTADSDTSVPVQAWFQTTVCLAHDSDAKQTQVKLWQDGNQLVNVSWTVIYYHPTETSTSLLGAQLDTPEASKSEKGQFYTGFIYEFCMYNECLTETDSFIDPNPECDYETGFCKSCPIDTCLIDCEYDQFLNDQGLCKNCDADCEEGCVREDNCNPCLDPECAVCDTWETCETCKENATKDENEDCTCDSGYFYDSELDICQQCHSTCSSCYDEDQLSCTACIDGYYTQPDADLCLEACPSGWRESTSGDPTENTCVYVEDYEACYIFDTDRADVTVGDITLLSGPTDAEETQDPLPLYQRGMYFDGTQDFMSFTPGLILHHTFTLHTWIKISGGDDKTIFSVSNNTGNQDEESILLWNYMSDGKIHVVYSIRGQIVIDFTTSQSLVTGGQWQLIAMCFEYEKDPDPKTTITVFNIVRLEVGGFSSISETSENTEFLSIFTDRSSYSHLVGAQDNYSASGNFRTSFLSGYIFEFCIYNSKVTTFIDQIGTDDCGTNYCQLCPSEQCVTECEWNEFQDAITGSCSDCKEECTEGCVRDTDCNTCSDPICDICLDWETCDTCLANGQVSVDGTCECRDTYYYDVETDQCEKCDEACDLCDGAGIYNCSTCADGLYLQPDSAHCASTCPTGWKTSPDRLCVDDPDMPTGGCFVFTGITDTWQMDPATGAEIIGGYGTTDPVTDPIPSFERGVFFDGIGRFLSITGYLMNHTNTIEVWIRFSSNSAIFSMNNLEAANDDHLTYFIQTGQSLGASYFPASFSMADSNSSFTLQKWHYVMYSLIWNKDTQTTTVQIFVDTIDEAQSTFDQALTDDSSMPKFVGAEMITNGQQHEIGEHFEGFMYKFCINNDVPGPNDWTPDHGCGTGYCENCPADSTCLSECDEDQFRNDSGECKDCLPECEAGCRREENCNVCDDNECAECDGFGEDDCTECIDRAEEVDNDCQCEDNYTYSVDKHECTLACDPACEVCDDATIYTCDECADGYFKQVDSRICINRCPTGTTESGKECVEIADFKACFDFDKDQIDYVSSVTEIRFQGGRTDADGEVDDPIPVYRRGLYFDGDAFGEITGLVLNHSFLLEFWFRSQADGTIFSINKNDNSQAGAEDFIEIITVERYVILSGYRDGVVQGQVSTPEKFAEDEWTYYAVCSDLQDDNVNNRISIYAKGISVAQNSFPAALIDQEAYSKLLGAEVDTGLEGNPFYANFFTGFIFNMCYHNSCDVELNYNGNPQCINEDDWCTECPINPGGPQYCLMHCAWNQYYDEDTETCIPCNADCVTCVHGGNCDPCIDLECKSCLNWEDCDDGGCGANAEATGEDGECVCSEGFYFELDSHTCESCNASCKTCTGPLLYQCPSCQDGFFKQIGTDACLSSCASGFTENTDTNECEGEDVKVFCATFQDKIVSEDTNEFGVDVVGSGDPANDPMPIYRRGLYFDGIDDYLKINNFRLHYEFTITAWVRVTGGKNIFSSNRVSYTELNDENSINFGVHDSSDLGDVDSDPVYLYFLYARGSEDFSRYPDPNKAYEYLDWSFVAVVVQWDSTLLQTFARLWSDNVTRGHSQFNAVVADSPNYQHFIGVEQDTLDSGPVFAGFYHGFIYQLCVYNYPRLDFTDDIDPDGPCPTGSYCSGGKVGACPNEEGSDEPYCLINCEWNQFLDGDSPFCFDCDGCDEGCFREENCVVCEDTLCTECDNFEECNPDQCVDNASVPDGETACECNPGYYINESLDHCNQCAASCSRCYGSHIYECTECQSGFFLLEGSNTCYDECPSGFAASGGLCLKNQNNQLCFRFEDGQSFKYDWTDQFLGKVATGGANSGETEEDDDALNLLDRGIYFDGNDYLTIENYSSAPSFTIQVWLRIDGSTVGTMIYSVAAAN